MKSILFALLIFTCFHLNAQAPEEIYPVDSASVEHKDVPKGELIKCWPDGTLKNKQRYGWLHTPDDHDNAWPDGLKCDREGRIYVATNMGIQVLDQTGRINAILKIPSGTVSNCCFGGPDFNVLYITCGDKVYKRKLKVKGVNSFDSPFKMINPKF